jgi:hypothetical protein
MFVHVILVHMVKMAVVKIVHMAVMANRGVPAFRTMLMSVIGMMLLGAGRHDRVLSSSEICRDRWSLSLCKIWRASQSSPVSAGVFRDHPLATLALSPICDTLVEGFSHFVTSMTAPIASGWSGCRMGFAPTVKEAFLELIPQFESNSGNMDRLPTSGVTR